MLRTSLSLITALLICFSSNSQSLKLGTLDGQKINKPANTYREEQKYPCELSRIGKLIVKPLVKDSVIHYEFAITDLKDKRNEAQSGVSISKDSVQQTSVARFTRQKNKILQLIFVHPFNGDNCAYYMKLLSNEGIQMISFLIDGTGNVISRNNKDTMSNEERMNAQREVNAWLTYFE